MAPRITSIFSLVFIILAVFICTELQATSLELVLMGVVGGGNRNDSRAIILNKKDRSQQIYQVGDVVAGGRIKSIEWGKVVLSAGGREEVLDMSETAQYRAGATAGKTVAGPVAVAVPDLPREKAIASSERAAMTYQLVPERVRLVLPDRQTGSSPDGE